MVGALLSATIGVILRIIAERFKVVGELITSITGLIWSLLTFFVIPVMIFENRSILQSIKQSGYLFKKTWGEHVIGQFSMALFFTFLGLRGLIPLLLGFLTNPCIIITVIYWVLLAIISSCLNGIFVAALYNYALTGQVPAAYSPEVIEGAFKPKTVRRIR